MSEPMTPVSKDDPLWKAWVLYEQSNPYRNTRRWAGLEQHVDGSMWAAFSEGWNARNDELNRLRARVEAYFPIVNAVAHDYGMVRNDESLRATALRTIESERDPKGGGK